MATYFWGVPPGVSESFDIAANWFDVAAQGSATAAPGVADTINVVGAVPIGSNPPVHIIIPSGKTDTVSRLQVLFQSVDDDFVWFEGSLTVLDEVFFENDRGNLRFIGTITLDGATMDVDYLHVGGSRITSARNVVAVDDDGMFRVTGGAEVTTRRLELLGTGGLEVSNGGAIRVEGPAFLQGTDALSPRAKVTGGQVVDGNWHPSSLVVQGDLIIGEGLEIWQGASALAHDVTINSKDSAWLHIGTYFPLNSGDPLSPTSTFAADNLTLGDGNKGIGFIEATFNSYVHIAETVTLRNAKAALLASLGTIEIGGTAGAAPGTIQIDHDGSNIGLKGQGVVEAVTLVNNGIAEARDGLLFIEAKVSGSGTIRIESNATLQIHGSFDAGGTVELTGTFAKLTLDDPRHFGGAITSIDFTDTIQLNNTGAKFGNGVYSAGIVADGNGGHLLAVFQNNEAEPLVYKVSGTGNLVGTSIVVSETADHDATYLTLTSIGTTTTSYLDSQGREVVRFASGDGDHNNVNSLYFKGGEAVSGKSGDAPEHVYFDYTKGQLNAFRDDWTNVDGTKGYIEAIWDNSDASKVMALYPNVALQDPSSPDVTQLHNLWYSFRHGPLQSVEGFDGTSKLGLDGILGHYFSFNFVDGIVESGVADPTSRALKDYLDKNAAPPMAEAFAAVEPQAVSSPPAMEASNTFRLVEGAWDTVNGVWLSFLTNIYNQGAISTISYWERLSGGKYHRIDYNLDPVSIIDFVQPYTPQAMEAFVLPELAKSKAADKPVIHLDDSRKFEAPIEALTIGRAGDPVVDTNGAVVTGINALHGLGGAPVFQDRRGLNTIDLGDVPANDGAGLTAGDAAKALWENAKKAAEIVAGGGGNAVDPRAGAIVAGGGGNVVSTDGAGIVAGGGGNLVARMAAGSDPEVPSKVVDAGFGNALTLAGIATPGRYLANAVVFADANGDRQLDNGEAWTITDAKGHFQLYGGWGTLVLVGGTDTGTNLPFTGILTSPLGSTDISALTTLASGLAADDGDIDGAIKQLQKAMSLDSKLDFTVIDPVASAENGDAASAKIHVEMSKTMDAVVLIGAAFSGLGANQSKAQQAAFDSMVGAINKSGTLNLSDKATVETLVASVGGALGIDGSKIAATLAGSVVSTSELLDKLLVDKGSGVGLTSGIGMVETGVQGTLASSLKASGGDASKLAPAALLLQAVSDDGKSIVTSGHVVTITLTTSELVNVTGAPTLVLNNGKLASFAGGSGGSTLTFKYAVQAGDGASDLHVISLGVSGTGAIEDTSGNKLAGSVAGDLGLAIDAGSLVSIAALSAAKAEEDSGTIPFAFTVTLNVASATAQTIGWSVAGSGDHPADAVDFVGGLPSGTLTFAAGETSKTITLPVAGDVAVEFDDFFTVVLSSPSAGLVIGTSSALGIIQNDDRAHISIVPLSASKAEGSSGVTAFTFTVGLDQASKADQTADWTVAGAGVNAANAADFGGAFPSGSVSFAAGEISKVVTILVTGDTTAEFNEDFAVSLSNLSSGLAPGTGSATGTIQNDDKSVVSITGGPASRSEGDVGTTSLEFTVALDRAGVASQSVDWAVTGAGPHPADGADFGGSLPSGTLLFAPGETSKTVTLAVSGDTTVEFDEGAVLTLSNQSAGLTLGNGTASTTIVNDDLAVVSIAASSASKQEGSAGTTSFTFTVSLGQGAVAGQTVDWGVAGSGAHAADTADFGGALPAGTVSFAAGETSKTVTVAVSGDSTVEFDEEFSVALSNASAGLALGASTAVGTILNDDGTVVSITALSAAKAEGNGGSTSFTFTVGLSQAGVTGLSVDWGVAGTGVHAANAADFGGALPAGTVSFAAGETSKTVTIAVSGDTAVEFDEDFTVALKNASTGLTLGAVSTATGTIQNDDRSIVSVAAASASKDEGNSGSTAFGFTVTLDQAGTASQTVNWSVTGSGANPASAPDFVGGALPSGTLTFAAGETSKALTVSVAGDTTVEPNEGFSVGLSNLSAGLAMGVGSAPATIQNDDTSVVALATHDDAYIVQKGQPLAASAGVLTNDTGATTASLLAGPTHGTLQLAANGTFNYTAAAGFFGVDSFTYHASNGGSAGDGQALIYVVPVIVGASTTLDLLSLNAEEQIAATYAAFFGRGGDASGFGFWVGQFNANLATQGGAALFANIASSFGVSDEAKALYPFLVNPFGASDGQISAFLDSVYNNLFNRGSDAAGLAYWTSQVKATLAAGQFVGSILINIMSGAQDTADGKDITTLMGKVAVSLAFVREQEEHHTVWAGASDTAAATTLLHGVTADPQTVLVGVRNAETMIAAHA